MSERGIGTGLLGVFAAATLFTACGGPDGTDAGPTDAGIDAGATDGGGPDLGPDTGTCVDADGDGHAAISCGGDDCDDTNPHRYPGNPEVCDAAGVDEDCDPSTLGPDADGDGTPYIGCCNPQPGGGVLCGTDCDDHAMTINTSAVESCNGVDDDCDGMVDEGLRSDFCNDADGDAHGDLATAALACAIPVGSTGVCNDCQDANVAHHPGATELCNGVDDNCDGVIDEHCTCTMGETRACGMTLGACMAGVQGCPSGTWETACTGGVFPTLEVCNGIDDDCDGMVDEGTTYSFFADCDVDGYGSTSTVVEACTAPTAVPPGCGHGVWAMVGDDCADDDATRYPGHGCTPTADGGVDGGTDGGVDGGTDAGPPDLGPPDSGIVCTPPMLDCTAAAGCETNGDITPAHCGSCANACAWSCETGTCHDARYVRTGDRSCAIRDDMTLACWGTNGSGALGDGTTTTRATPVVLPGVAGVVDSCSGMSHGCAVLSTGTVLCWGTDTSGQLGDGPGHVYSGCSGACSPTPVTVSGITTATHVACGQNHTCAVLSDGTVKCWGAGGGILGDGTVLQRDAPVFATGVTDAVSISSSRVHTCVVRMGGGVQCWGDNAFGALGDRTTTNTYLPVDVYMLSDAQQVAAGSYFTCALRTGGTAVCWGYDVQGELGDGTATSAPRDHPTTAVTGVTTGVQITAGTNHACVRNADGTLVCWGNNGTGQLGDGSVVESHVPVAVSGLAGVTDVAAGNTYTCAVAGGGAGGGAVWCWGTGGALGVGDGLSRHLPTPTLPPS